MFKKFLSVAAALLCGVGVWSFELEGPARIFPADSRVTLRFKAVSKWAKQNFDTVQVGYVRDDRRRISTGVSPEAAVRFVDFSDMPNVRLCLEHSKPAETRLRVTESGDYRTE